MATGRERSVAAEPRAVVLVEGISDQAAVRVLARRLGRDLDAERISVVAIGGATNIRSFLAMMGPPRPDLKLVGLCDAREAPLFSRELGDASVFVCDRDLEDELIRALGPAAAEEALARNGELEPFRTLQNQPAWRGQPPEDQLHRFLRSQSRRRIAAIEWLVEALDLNRLPQPLERLLGAV